jgi:hypothetical protein
MVLDKERHSVLHIVGNYLLIQIYRKIAVMFVIPVLKYFCLLRISRIQTHRSEGAYMAIPSGREQTWVQP